MAQTQETELVQTVHRAQSGDAEAFHDLFLRFGKPVLAFIYNLIGDRHRSEELTQETFIRAYRRLWTIRNPEQLSTWLFGIARNVVRETIRRQYRRAPKVALDENLAIADPRAGPDADLFAGELGRTIRDALASLPEDHRLIFVLKILNQMPYEEISAITGASVGKLKTDLHRAKIEMRRRLQPYLGGSARRIRGES